MPTSTGKVTLYYIGDGDMTSFTTGDTTQEGIYIGKEGIQMRAITDDGKIGRFWVDEYGRVGIPCLFNANAIDIAGADSISQESPRQEIVTISMSYEDLMRI